MMEVFLTKECAVCQRILKTYPNQKFKMVEDDIDKAKSLGILAVPAVYIDNRVYYGFNNVVDAIESQFEDRIPF
jgi:predicted thioredoxin/glutaredoxin